MNKKIAVFGGSFSPPHLGHAAVIEGLLRMGKFDEVWVMPSADRRDKKISTPGLNRLEMCRLMIKELFSDSPTPILLSDEELNMPQLTTTHGTNQLLKGKYADHDFYFVIGADLVKDIKKFWVDGEKLWEEANLIIAKGPCANLPEELPPHSIVMNDFGWLSISSTYVRNLVAGGYSGLPYLTKSVASYIQKNDLYKIKS